MTEQIQLTATSIPTRKQKERILPLSEKLRNHSIAIILLLRKYEEYRHGDTTWRFGDQTYNQGDAEYLHSGGKSGHQPGHSAYECPDCGEEFVTPPQQIVSCPKCKKDVGLNSIIRGFPPNIGGQPPQIREISSPNNLREKTGTSETLEPLPDLPITNPMLIALKNMGELSESDAQDLVLDQKINILQDLGVVERLHCGVLIPWARQLRATMTYLLEMREVYSTDIKTIYPEMLSDLEVAIGTCDELANVLGNQNGVMATHQYRKIVTKLMHYAQIAAKAGEQLADQHEDYGSSQGNSPFDGASAEAEWVNTDPDEVLKQKPPTDAESLQKDIDDASE